MFSPTSLHNANMPSDLGKALLASLDGSCAAVALFDPQDRLCFANASFRDAFAVAPDAFPTWADMMRHCYQHATGLLIETDDIETWIARIGTKRYKVPVRTFESDLIDGRWLWMVETLQPDGSMFVIGSDITPLKTNENALRQARDKAIKAAHTDVLTGLFNRRFILARLGEVLAYSRSVDRSLSVGVVDLDYFKLINDTYGHQAGDQVLQHFAERARHSLRPLDVLGRIGGEEFLLLFPDTDLTGAAHAIERLRRVLKKKIPLPEWPDLSYTFSAGLTDACDADTQESLFHRADLAMYSAKQSGRNRNVIIPSREA